MEAGRVEQWIMDEGKRGDISVVTSIECFPHTYPDLPPNCWGTSPW